MNTELNDDINTNVNGVNIIEKLDMYKTTAHVHVVSKDELDNVYNELSNTIMENETIIATKFKKLEDKLNNILIALLFPSLIMNIVIIFILLWIYKHG